MREHCENSQTPVVLCTDGTVGNRAVDHCESRQARKGATVADDLGALDLLTDAIFSQGTTDQTMSQLALARKWRPHNFNEVIGQTHVVQAFVNALNNNKLHHAYLLTGTRGVGKTTLARILAKCLNCEQGVSANPCGQCQSCIEIDEGRFADLYEVDAASRTKVEDTRELLDNVQYAATKGRYKIYLIDEVHMLSGHSFNALLKTLEEPPEHVKFILATTDPEKLPQTVLSRCLQFHLLAMTPEQIAGHLADILQKESISFDETALKLLAKAANGSMRDSLSLLDQAIAFGNDQVDIQSVRQMLGTIEPTHLYDITDALIQADASALLAITEKLAGLGADFNHVLADLNDFFHALALHQFVAQTHFDDPDRASTLATQLTKEDIQLYYQIGIKSTADMALAPSARAGFEMALLRMHAFSHQDTPVQIQTHATPTATTTAPAKTAKAETTAQAPINTAKTTAAAASQTDNDWANMVQQMPLKGMARVLAQNCALKSLDDKQALLHVDTNAKALLQDKHVKTINSALNELLNKNIRLEIHVSDTHINTPDTIAKNAKEAKREKALDAIQNDDKVKKIMQHFDAEIVESSIVLKDE